jgi:hypothetical protein
LKYGTSPSFSGFLERIDGGVGHLGVAQDVAPVHDGGGAVADLVERADQVAEVHVARLVVQRELLVHVAVVIADADPVRADAAQLVFPGMDVRVDEAGHRDAAAAVDHLGVGRGEVAADLRDLRAVDEDVAALEVADLRVQREDESVLDERLGHVPTLTASRSKIKRYSENP